MDDFIKIRVIKLLEILNEGLGPYVIESFIQHYGTSYKSQIKGILRFSHEISFDEDEKLLESIDTQGWLDLILKRKRR